MDLDAGQFRGFALETDLRLREGVERFGIVGQSAGLQEATDGDTTLFLRMLFLFMVAQKFRNEHGLGKAGFILENLRDEGHHCPMFWVWPEWKTFPQELWHAACPF